MATSSIGSLIGNAANSGVPISKPRSTLDMQTFLKLLTVQMSSQDPLNPVSDSEFAAQLAQMGTVQGMDNLQQAGQVQESAALLGKTVTATNPSITATNSASTITGRVVSMTNQSGTYLLGLQDAAGNVTNVSTTTIQSVTF